MRFAEELICVFRQIKIDICAIKIIQSFSEGEKLLFKMLPYLGVEIDSNPKNLASKKSFNKTFPETFF